MKIIISTFAILAGLVPAAVTGQEKEEENLVSRTIEMRPTEKRSLALKPSERNPYAQRTPQDGLSEDEEQGEEEIAIRKKLGALQVTGGSRNNNNKLTTVLLGDIRIKRGMIMPQLLTNQTQQLKVTEITENKIVLGWLDIETGELTGKTMQLPFDLSPSVIYVLHGQGGAVIPGVKKTRQMGVLKPASPSATQGFEIEGRRGN